MRGPHPDPIRLSTQEREDLERLLRRHTTTQQIALRARMIVRVNQSGMSQTKVE
jgi:hypothetical protein